MPLNETELLKEVRKIADENFPGDPVADQSLREKLENAAVEATNVGGKAINVANKLIHPPQKQINI